MPPFLADEQRSHRAQDIFRDSLESISGLNYKNNIVKNETKESETV